MTLAAPLPASAHQIAPAVPFLPAPPALRRAQLGQALGAWRRTAPGAAAACAPADSAGAVTCTLASAPIRGGYRARDISYRFVGGRMATLSWRASIDALPYVTSQLKGEFGEPLTLKRGELKASDGAEVDHLGMRWSQGGATAQLSDPARSLANLSVVMTAAPATPARG